MRVRRIVQHIAADAIRGRSCYAVKQIERPMFARI